jgi:nucleoside-diphosphate-sugar epimerase
MLGMDESKRILVTGANGFIGKALCGRLVSDGWLVNGAVRSAKAAQVVSGVTAVEIDGVDTDTDWGKALLAVDTVVHLAARVHVVRDDTADPLIAYRKINVAGTDNLARQAVAAGVRRFVFLSTVKVNGEESWGPLTETDTPAPVDSYGISKMEAERKLHRIAAATKLAVVILRAPLVYGPGVKANFLKLLQTVERGTPLPFAGVKNQRSLIYLENLVDAIVACIRHPNASGQTYLVSDGDDVSTPELIRMIAASLHKPPRIFAVPGLCLYIAGRLAGKGPTMDRLIGSLTVDTSKIRADLGWAPPFTLAKGIEETVAWFRGFDASSR